MKKNEEITILANEIMIDITDDRRLLHIVLLKCSRLSLLVDMPQNVKLFQDWAKYAESNSFVISSFNANIEAAKDPNISLASANPNQVVSKGFGNAYERTGLRQNATQVISYMANYRSQAYSFASNIYQKWQFGNVAQSIFELKRSKTEQTLRDIFPDVDERLNSIDQNLRGTSKEDWKNAVVSCRTLLMDIADILLPPTNADEKGKYINRLKQYVNPKSKTKQKLLKTYLDEINKRIELTCNLTQGSAHQNRPIKKEAEDVVLYTYLVVAELVELYNEKNSKVAEDVIEQSKLMPTKK